MGREALCAHCKQYSLECTFFLPITETRFKKKKQAGKSFRPFRELTGLMIRGTRSRESGNYQKSRSSAGYPSSSGRYVQSGSHEIYEMLMYLQALHHYHSSSIPPFLQVHPKHTIFGTIINGRYQKMEMA
jgi:hypothetical protein